MEEIPSLPLDFEEPQKAPSHAYSKDSITQDLRWVGSLGRTGKAPGRSGWDEGEETGSPWAHLQPREGSECWKPRGAWFKGIPSGSIVKNLPANAGDTRDMGLIPGSGRFPGGGHGNPHSTLAWKIPWTEEPGGYSPWGCEESDMTEHACTSGGCG